MTASILLIRHAAHAQVGSVLSGRVPGIALSVEGQGQAERLARHLTHTRIDAIHASPVQRAQETALAIATGHPDLVVETCPDIEELDFGDWAGRSFVELADDPQWSTWNSLRESARAPNGESMAQAQERAWAHVEQTAASMPDQTIAMVSHCDVIRAIVAKVLGLSLNHIHRFDVDPASLTRIMVGSWGSKVLSLNETYP